MASTRADSARNPRFAPRRDDDRRPERRGGCGGEAGVDRGQLPLPIGPNPASLPAGCEWIAVPVTLADEVRAYVGRRLTIRVDSLSGPRLQRAAEAVAALAALGVGGRHANERTAFVLLALLALPPGAPWSAATAPTLRIHDMLTFMRAEYGRDYAENTRETIRDESVKPLLAAGVAVANPDQPERAATSPKFCYQVVPSALALLRACGTPGWETALGDWRESREARDRSIDR